MYEYDSFGRLSKAETGGKKAEYSYDGNGVRRSKTVEGKTTGYYMAGDQVINETENGSLSASNIIAGGIIGRITGGTSYMMLKNDHGDVVGLTANGEVKADYTYSAYGELIAGESNGINNPIRYAGEYTDEESGLIYLRARYYDPGLGRFISEDTHWNPSNMIYGDNPDENNPIPDVSAIIQSSNLYTYSMNDPVNFVDPSGSAIILTGITSKNDERFVNLQLLTDDKLDVDLKTGRVSYEKSKNVDREVASNLVRNVIDDAMKCEITIYNQSNGTTRNMRDANGNVTKTQIFFNPNYSPSEWSYVEGEGYDDRVKPAFMVLGHELVHVIRRMTGETRDVSKNGYYLSGPKSGSPLLRNNRPEELETVGIDYVKVINVDWMNATRVEASKNYYSENALCLEYDRVHQNNEGYVKMGRRVEYL